MASESTTVTLIKSDGRQRRSFEGLFDYVIPFKCTLEEDSIADAASSVAVVAVPGAALGDIVLVGPGVDLANLTFSASVISAGVVEIMFDNNTGAAATGLATPTFFRGIVLGTSTSIWDELD